MLDSALDEPSVKHVDSSNPLPTRHPFQSSQSQQNGSCRPVPWLSCFKITQSMKFIKEARLSVYTISNYLNSLIHISVAQGVKRDFKRPPNRIQVVFNNLQRWRCRDELGSTEFIAFCSRLSEVRVVLQPPQPVTCPLTTSEDCITQLVRETCCGEKHTGRAPPTTRRP